MKARILQFQLPSTMERGLSRLQTQQQHKSRRNATSIHNLAGWSGSQIARSRQLKGLSQRQLAEQLGKSQSWVRDVEKGSLRVKPEDGRRLQGLLDLDRTNLDESHSEP